jgi:phage terminase large subunit-like protein
MPYTKGKWARTSRGQTAPNTLRLSPYQVFVTCCVFGWVQKIASDDGRHLRRFSLAYITVPRKNGKSEWIAAIGNYMLAADGEQGAEVYCGATTEKQAWEVFRPAKAMADRTPRYRSAFGVETAAESLFVRRTGSRFQPIIGNPGDGASPSCSITDEYHEHKTDEQFDTMRTGMGAREQPLAIVITTAGSDISSPCHALQQEVQQILTGDVVDDRVFGIIYTIDENDDWTSDTALRKANPNLDVSVSRDYLVTLRNEAMRSARKQNTFKTKHLNLWVHAREPWMDMLAWGRCADSALSDVEFEGELAWGGLDLAAKLDIASLAYLFRRTVRGKLHYYLFTKHYTPEARVNLPEMTSYQGWAHDGHLIATEGNIIDYNRIEDDILELAERFAFEGWGYDPHGATKLVLDLQAKHVPMVEVPQTWIHLSEPMKELEALTVDGRLHHPDHPVLNWMVSNVTAKIDAKENVFPRKEKPENKIDGVVASIIALGRALVSDVNAESIYDTRGVVSA